MSVTSLRTVISHVAETSEPSVERAVITADPCDRADTRPDGSTVAIVSSEDDHIIDLLVALLGRIVVVN